MWKDWAISLMIGYILAGLVDVIIYSSPDDKKKNRSEPFEA